MAYLMTQECTCGERVRYVRGRYVPLAASTAPLSGHVAAYRRVDGGPRERVSDRVCTARRDELAARREAMMEEAG